jgi:hypothetical protein
MMEATLSFWPSSPHLFIFNIKTGTTAPHQISLAVVRVVWCVNSYSAWCVCQEITAGSPSVAILFHLHQILKDHLCTGPWTQSESVLTHCNLY